MRIMTATVLGMWATIENGKNSGEAGAETLGISSGNEIDKRGPENEAALWATEPKK